MGGFAGAIKVVRLWLFSAIVASFVLKSKKSVKKCRKNGFLRVRKAIFSAKWGENDENFAYFASFLASFRSALDGAGSRSVLTTLQRTVQLTEAPGARVV